MNIFWLFNHPAPYKIDFFNELGKSVSITAVFERDSEAGRNAIFYGEKARNFQAIICRSIKFGGIDNYTHAPISILQKGHFDVVVINGWMTLTERRTISYCKRHRIPYIFVINGGIAKEKEPFWKRNAKRKYIPGAAAYLAPDEASKDYLVHYGVSERLISLYPYSSVYADALAPHAFTEDEKAPLRKELGLQGKKIYISSGQLIERKNFKEMIRNWNDAPEDSHLYITGEGPQKEELLALIESLHLQNVHLLPYQKHDRLFEYYRACDAFLFLTKEDIYGHVINEAMSQGLPVISSRGANAAGRLIEPGKNGFLIPLGDPKAFWDAIQGIGPTFGKAALQTARKNTQETSASFFAFYLENFRKTISERPQQ